MSDTYEIIQESIKVAMKSGDTTTRDVLRMVVSDIKNKTVNEGKDITEESVTGCLKKFVKQIEDSIASAKMAARTDLEEKARGELAIVSQFLPSMIPNEQMKDIISDLVAENTKKLGRPLTKRDFGGLMKMLPFNCDKKYCSGIIQGLLK